MDDLRYLGFIYYEIADILNLKGIVSPTNEKYTSQLVETSLFKFLNRLKSWPTWPSPATPAAHLGDC